MSDDANCIVCGSSQEEEDILKQAEYALANWNLSIGHETLIRSLMKRIRELINASHAAGLDEIERMEDISEQAQELEKTVEALADREMDRIVRMNKAIFKAEEIIEVLTEVIEGDDE